MKKTAWVAAVVALVCSVPAGSQEVCDLTPAELAALAVQLRSVARGLQTVPLQSPPSSEVAAPANAATDDPVPDASFPALVAMHFGVPTSMSDTGAITFNLTPFAIVAARDPGVIDDQTKYEKYERHRRLGFALTLGGEGEAFDRDGDGAVDDALEAEDLSDIASAELRYRFHGTRDRRDGDNTKKYFRATDKAFLDAAAAFSDVAARVVPVVLTTIPSQQNGLFCPSDAEMLAQTQAEFIDAQARKIVTFIDTRREILEEIDAAPIWTFVAGATQRKDEFGSDQWWLGVRGAGGLGPDQGWSVSLDYGVKDSLAGGDEAKRIKAGVEWASLVAKRLAGPDKDGIRASLSGAYEKWQDVPGTGDDEVASLNFKLTYPLTDTINIPLSVTWANKKELLVDESEVRGYIGFTLDFDGALRRALATTP